MKHILVAVALVMVCLMPGVSQAITIPFSDNFDDESLGPNHSFTDNWTVFVGTVDLIGLGGGFDLLPGNGRYVDLDGSTGDAGIMRSGDLTLLGGTTYVLTFDLAGSQRGDANILNNYGFDTGIDNIANILTGGPLSRDSSDPFSTETVSFTVPVGPPILGALVFGQEGGDNVGLLFDNVFLNVQTDVPEPASLMLLGAGLAGIGIWRRKATKLG